MHETGEPTTPAQPPAAPVRLPAAAWAVAWSFVAGQVFALVSRGTQPVEDWPLSILVGVALVCFFSHGVLRARLVRFWFVVVVAALSLVFYLFTLLADPTLVDLGDALLTAVQLGTLLWLHRSPWFAWQRTRPRGGPSIAPLMALAVLVGIGAGVLGTSGAGVSVSFDV